MLLGLHTTDQEGAYEGNVNVETSYHQFNVPYTFRVARGSLQTLPKELIFDPVFPGTKAELKLKVFSSFAEEMITETVAPVPPDPRFSFKGTVINGRNVIMSGERSLIGKVIFDPAATCRQDNSCYAGFDLQSNSKSSILNWYFHASEANRVCRNPNLAHFFRFLMRAKRGSFVEIRIWRSKI